MGSVSSWALGLAWTPHNTGEDPASYPLLTWPLEDRRHYLGFRLNSARYDRSDDAVSVVRACVRALSMTATILSAWYRSTEHEYQISLWPVADRTLFLSLLFSSVPLHRHYDLRARNSWSGYIRQGDSAPKIWTLSPTVGLTFPP